jgi:glutathione S-transferase
MTNLATASDILPTLQHTFPGKVIALSEQAKPALHLFHAANSICSQKIRVVLAAMQQPYTSHQLNIFRGETYDPNYVRLRSLGCDALGLPLADHHSGSTAVTSAGCDACVVPTVVDSNSNEILIDSQNICLTLVDRNADFRDELFPVACQESILQELSVIDEFPNYQVLASSIDKKTGTTDPSKNGFAIGKVQRCNDLIEQFADDQILVRAYRAKRDKEQSAANNLFDKKSMDQARATIVTTLENLNQRLQNAETAFLFTDNPTLADLFWGLELMRIDDLGMNSLWADITSSPLRKYYQRLCALPCLDEAVTQWEGARL